jgi:hypothetical protein
MEGGGGVWESGTHSIGEWVDPKVGPQVLERRRKDSFRVNSLQGL